MQDDGFPEMDDLFGGSFGGHHFGSQDSFFGGGHFQYEDHARRHQQAHQRAHQQNYNAHHQFRQERHDGDEFGAQAHSFAYSSGGGGVGGGRTCRTVTQRVGNMVTTYTTCS